MMDWILAVLGLAPKDPQTTARRFEAASSNIGDRLRWPLYGLIGGALLLLAVALGILWRAG